MRLLLIGNSLTYYNGGIDYHLQRLYETPTVHVSSFTKGGANLRRLWRKTIAKRVIREEEWDFVILQEDLPETNLEHFLDFGQRFVKLVREQNSVPIFYETWAYDRIPTVTDEDIAEAHRILCSNLHVPHAPVRRARLIATEAGINVWSEDMEHPNLAGTYLAALVIFYTVARTSKYLLGHTPSEYFPEDLDRATALQIRQIAKTMWSDDLSTPYTVREELSASNGDLQSEWIIDLIVGYLDAESLVSLIAVSSALRITLCSPELDKMIWQSRFEQNFGAHLARVAQRQRCFSSWRLAYLSEHETQSEISASVAQGLC